MELGQVDQLAQARHPLMAPPERQPPERVRSALGQTTPGLEVQAPVPLGGSIIFVG